MRYYSLAPRRGTWYYQQRNVPKKCTNETHIISHKTKKITTKKEEIKIDYVRELTTVISNVICRKCFVCDSCGAKIKFSLDIHDLYYLYCGKCDAAIVNSRLITNKPCRCGGKKEFSRFAQNECIDCGIWRRKMKENKQTHLDLINTVSVGACFICSKNALLYDGHCKECKLKFKALVKIVKSANQVFLKEIKISEFNECFRCKVRKIGTVTVCDNCAFCRKCYSKTEPNILLCDNCLSKDVKRVKRKNDYDIWLKSFSNVKHVWKREYSRYLYLGENDDYRCPCKKCTFNKIK